LQKVMLVEDDPNIRELVRYTLGAAGFSVEAFEDGESFERRLREETPQLLLLDIMLPGESGLQLLRRLKRRPRTESLPVILLTAKGGEMDRVHGLDEGADDYITKPFSVLELTARVRALLRRSGAGETGEMRFDAISLSPQRREVTVDGIPVAVTFKEFEILHYLLRNPRHALSREQILSQVWGVSFEGESRTVDMHIMSLRQKLGKQGEWIQTVRGVGYKMGE